MDENSLVFAPVSLRTGVAIPDSRFWTRLWALPCPSSSAFTRIMPADVMFSLASLEFEPKSMKRNHRRLGHPPHQSLRDGPRHTSPWLPFRPLSPAARPVSSLRPSTSAPWGPRKRFPTPPLAAGAADLQRHRRPASSVFYSMSSAGPRWLARRACQKHDACPHVCLFRILFGDRRLIFPFLRFLRIVHL